MSSATGNSGTIRTEGSVGKPAGRLSRRTKLAYGFGDIGFSLTGTILGAYFAIFLVEVVGLRPALAALILLVGNTWDYINDPVIGYLSDCTRSRWGRRRPFLIFGAAPLAATFALLWWRPPLAGTTALVIYYMVVFVLWETAATVAYMPYFALTPELTDDYDERTSLTSYRMLFSIVGSLIAFTVPLLIIGRFIPEAAERVFRMGLLFGAAAAVPLWIVAANVRERPELTATSSSGLGVALRAALRNRPFLLGLGMFLATWLSIALVQSMLLFYVDHVVDREAQQEWILATVFVTAVLALPLWNFVATRWSKRRAYVLGISFWALVQLLLITLGADAGMPVILTLCVLAGIGVSAAHVLPWSIIPDTIEWGEWQSGQRNEGLLYSLVMLVQKAAASLAIAGALLILDLSGYVANAAVQAPSAVLGIRLVIGPLPAALLLGGIALALAYRLDRARYSRIAAELRARRAAAGRESGSEDGGETGGEDGEVVPADAHRTTLPVEVAEVHGGADRRAFLTFPWRLYRGDPLWVPPLLGDRARRTDPARGPFFTHGAADFFLARRGGRPVGTVCAAHDPPVSEARGVPTCVFGFFDYVDEPGVAEALLARVDAWAGARGLQELYGPFDLDYENAYGVLVDGWTRPAALMCGYSPRYYAPTMARLGFEPARAANVAFELDLDRPELDLLLRRAETVRRRRTVTIRAADFARWDEEADMLVGLLNRALGSLPGHVDWRRDTLDPLLESVRALADPALVLFADVGGETVGFLPNLPNLNQVLIHANGLRWPWNRWWTALRLRRPFTELTVKSVVVDPKYWKRGVATLLFGESLERARARGYRWADLSITGADNPNTVRLATRIGGREYKRWQVYKRAVSSV